MPKRSGIVCGVDGSPVSADLARIAARLAEALRMPLEVVHVLGAHDEIVAAAMLDGVCDSSDAQLAHRRLVPYGDPAARLARIAEDTHAALIVVGAHGRQSVAHPLLGSVSTRLAADAPCPVLVVAPGLEGHVRPEDWRGRTIVCGFDGSEPGFAAAREAALLAARLGGSLSVVTIGIAGVQQVEDLLERLHDTVEGLPSALDGATRLEIRHELRAGDPVWELERVAAAATAPLIVVGSRGRGPATDPLLGAVARSLLRGARRPILVLPAAALPATSPA